MPETSNIAVLHGGPLRVWSALIDPEQRDAWTPLIQLDDPTRLGATRCAFSINGWSKPIRMKARVEQLAKPHLLSWSCGIGGVLRLTERFELADDDAGTRLTHRLAIRGALALAFTAATLPHLQTMLIEADERFAQYLRWRANQPSRGIDRQRVPRRYRKRSG